MNRLDRYADWLVANANKKGTPEFETVANAYRELRGLPPAQAAAEQPKPETTTFGHIKEFGKGLVPGAVGLVESALIGGSAILPDEAEAEVRADIARLAGAAKRPFAAAAGYEDSVGRKLGEAVGSTVPFLAAGPFGLAGRIAATGLGVGAGAGEARTRAEQEGATAEQRGTATALGMIPGALEVFAPFRILGRLPDATTASGVQMVRRALQAGGEEAAQEAASNWAQNLIAKGVYKPEQELIEGLGEAAAYGGATGALIQGVLDLAIGRRARGTAAADEERAALEERVLAQEAEQEERAVQREMRGETPAEPETDLFGQPVSRVPAAPPQLGDLYADRAAVQEQIAALPEGADPTPLQTQLAEIDARIQEIGAAPSRAQMDLGLDNAREYEDIVLERARLEQGEQTPEVARRLGALKRRSDELLRQGVVDRRKAMRSAFSQPDQQVEMRETLVEGAPQQLPQTAEPEAREPTLRQAIAARMPTMQMPLMFEAEPEALSQEQEMTVPEGAITLEDLQGIGVPMRTSKEWFKNNVVGKTREQVQALVDANPKLLEGKGDRARVLREILAPEVPAFQEATDATPDVRSEPEADGQSTEPSVGVPSAGVGAEPGSVDTSAAGVEPSDGAGVVPSGPDVSAEPVPESAPATALTEQEQAFDALVRAHNDSNSPDHDAARRIWTANQNNPAFVREYDRAMGRMRPQQPTAEAEPTDTTAEEDIEAVRRAPQSGAAIRKRIVDLARSRKTAPVARRAFIDAEIAELRDRERALLSPEVQRDRILGTRSAELTAAVEAGDARGALEAIRDGGERVTTLDREVASRLLRARSLPRLEVVPDMDAPGRYNSVTDTVEMREIDSHTVLHEFVHANTHRAIVATQEGRIENLGVRRLENLFEYVKRTNPRLADEYGLSSLTEFAAESMSNPDFQSALQRIPYQRSSAMTEFARAVLRILGISPTTQNTALAEAMIATESIMADGRRLQDAEFGMPGSVPQLKRESKQAMQPAGDFDKIVQSSEAYQGQPSEFKRALTQLGDAFSKAEGVTFGDRFRTLTVDAGATMERRINHLFDGAVRSAKGILNPMGLYRQAQDNAKLLLTWAEDGALIKDPASGTYYTGTKEGVPSVKEVLTDVKAFADAQGISFEAASAKLSKLLEAKRLDALRKANKNEGTEFAINKLSNKDPRSADEQIDIALKEYAATPEVTAIQAKLDKIRFDLIDGMERVGRLTKEEAKAWKEASDYIPFERIEDFSVKFAAAKRTGTGIAQLGKLPDFVGSEKREVGNVLDNFVRTSGWMISQTLQQDATLTTLRMLEKMGYAKYLGKTPRGSMPEKTVQSYVDGEKVYFELPSRWDVLAFKEMAEPKGAIVSTLAVFSNILRKTITSLPPFAVRQVINDIQRAFVTSGVQNPYNIILPALRNFVSISAAEVMGKRHPSVKEFGKLGVVGDFDFNTRNPMDSIIYDLGFRARGPVQGLLHRLEGITRASDLAVRKAIYDQTMKESQDALLATTRAREFINFRRRGASAALPVFTSTIPFFNAYLQGMDVLYRAATGKGASASVAGAQARRLFYSKAATMAGFAAIYAIMMSGDDEYEDMSLRVRNTNWILPGGFKLPVPEELAALFKVPVEMGLEYMRRSGTPQEMEASEAAITTLKFAFEQYFGRTTPIPAAIKPVIEAWTNYSFFTGEQLEGTYQQQLLPTERTRVNTSELAKAISNFSATIVGERAAVSPIDVDNFLQGYFGSVAGMVTMGTDQLLNPDRMDRPMNRYWMLSNFLYDPVGTRSLDEFYTMREKAVPKLNTLRRLAETDIERAEKFMDENINDLSLAQGINAALAQLSDTRKYKTFLTSSAGAEAMSQEERAEALREVRQLEAEMVGWLREARKQLRDQ